MTISTNVPVNRERKSDMARRGLEGGQYKPLTHKDIEQIHATSLRVFAEVGVQVNSRPARELFKKAGASVDESSNVVKFSGDLVMEIMNRAPSVVRLCGRGENGEFDCEIGGKKVYMGTGGTALNVQEPGSIETRPSQLKGSIYEKRKCRISLV